jgi:digeranylgeranylglycerophospholipid reductase
MCAKTVAEAGISVLLLEKRPEVGTPVRCAEAVPSYRLESFLQPLPQWIASPINGGMVETSDGTRIVKEFPNVGYVLERKIFDRDLFAMAGKSGTHLATRSRAVGLVSENGKIRAVKVESTDGKETEVACEAVIGADGVESLVARWAGLNSTSSLGEVHSCAQVLANNVELPFKDYVHFYMGQEVAPGGYAWAFPKGEGRANLGLGITPQLRKDGRPAIAYLESFLKRYYPDSKDNIVEFVAGAVPATAGLKRYYRENLALVGDAAHFADPFSGAGIINALISGKLAGKAVTSYIAQGKRESVWKEEYCRPLKEEVLKTLDWYRKIKKVVNHLTDQEMSAAAKIINELLARSDEKGGVDFLYILRTALISHPQLLLKSRHLLG